VGVGVVEEFADSVPIGTGSVAKGLSLRFAERRNEDVADVVHGGGLLGRDGLGFDGFLKIGLNLADIGFIKILAGQRREMTGGSLGVYGTMQGLEVGGAETLMVGVGGKSAVAAVGEGEAAERRVGIVYALARHRTSLACGQATDK
jgi:hypothetical protein